MRHPTDQTELSGSTENTHQPKVIAHRGASAVAPENTLLAFKLAIEAGAAMIETDAHLTNDGVVCLIHDDALQRTTNCSGAVSNIQSSELAACDAGYWFDPRGGQHHPYRGLGLAVPSLSELIELIRSLDSGIDLNIEIKCDPDDSDADEPKWRAERLVEALVIQRMTGTVLLSSFNRDAIDHARVVAPHIRTAYICGPNSDVHAQIAYARSNGHNAIHPHHSLIGSGGGAQHIVEVIHDGELEVNVWTVNEPQRMLELASAGVDGIITDNPRQLRQVLERRAAGTVPH